MPKIHTHDPSLYKAYIPPLLASTCTHTTQNPAEETIPSPPPPPSITTMEASLDIGPF